MLDTLVSCSHVFITFSSFEILYHRSNMLILGIETSCDETAVALYDDDEGLIGHVLNTQISLHAPYGGVVPEIASEITFDVYYH